MGDESGFIDDACSRFEAAWQTGQQPRIEDFLPTESPEGTTLRDLLVPLVSIDLEWRWKTAGVSDQPVAREPTGTLSLPLRPRLADYVARYPLLGPVGQLPCDLIVNEYYARRRYGGRPTHAEYLDFFGSRHPDLAQQIQAIDDGMVSDLLDPSSEGLPETRLWQPEAESRRTGDDTTSKQPQSAAEGSVGRPDRIGRYRIERVLDKGAFGRVYRGYDDELKRPVAIKVPHRHLVDKPEDLDLYLEEAQVVASLDHANIVPVHDVGRTDDGLCYVVSKFIEGENLAERIRENRLSHCESAGLVMAIAEALHHAHRHTVVHRDVKPANILIDATGKPYLADFGLALKEEDFGSGPGEAGSAAYMSPEQARGESHLVDGRADIFSLGVVFYELLTANRPFRGTDREEVIERIRSLEARPPRQVDDSIPKELERICLKALSKRASDRYTTALDMAEDLRHFLAQTNDVKPVDSGKVEIRLVAPALVTPSPAGLDSGKSLKIVPKGLRAFDAQDADFFLELLPGPRDRDGLPESIRFWKYRAEETNSDKTFRVGVIYGPSGCGKSSLVKAGLLPRLAGHVMSIYVEATGDDTEARLLRGLQKQCPGLQENRGLKDSITVLRRGRGIPSGKKVLIILDQFEQWLHARKDEENTELVEALRQCDGERVQCIVMVRDDFWMAATRFMQQLEIRLVEGQNSVAVDLFETDHARRVLAAFGRAFGRLQEKSATKEQKQFCEQAVSGLAEGGKVVCVRLALFAEMMKGKPWTAATLKEVGGTEGVGVTFLEETFSANTAPLDHRYHQKAARAVLKALLPDSGTDIKGHMRSYAELLVASGYTGRPKDFHDLIGILDGEIRLITPTDREGKEWSEDSASQAKTGERYYQLTHDYLVHSLREWLTRKQRETRKGRAELRLAERATLWNAKPENRYLPSLGEFLNIRLLTERKNWTEPQKKIMRSAARHHGLCWVTGLVLAVTLGIILQQYLAAKRLENDSRRAELLVEAVLTAPADAVPYTIQNLKPLREPALPILERQYDGGRLPPSQRLHAAFAMAALGRVEQNFLVESIASARPDECRNLITALRLEQEAAVPDLRQQAEKAGKRKDWPSKARLAIVAMYLGESALALDMLQVEQRPDPVERTVFIKTFPTWHGDLSVLLPVLEAADDPAFRSGACCAMGSVSPDGLGPAEKNACVQALRDWYRSKPDTGTHGAAGFALGQWNVALPPIAPTTQPESDAHWYVNSMGMTMALIPAGEFLMGSPDSDKDHKPAEKPQHRVRITKPFWLGMHLVTVGQFRKFAEESKYYSGTGWQNAFRSQTDDYPVVNVSWYDAWAFCDWLTRTEGKEYRLPTEAEWEYACRAGTRTKYSFGDNESDLGDHAWFDLNSSNQAHAVGQKRPNAWGLSDMHGNARQWCKDWYDAGYYAHSATDDPTGPAKGAFRVDRGGGWYYSAGGCRSADRGSTEPVQGIIFMGFRVSAEGAMMTPAPVPPPPAGSATLAVAPFDEKKAKVHQEAWAKHLGVPVELINSIGMKLVLIPPGEFTMGSPKELFEENLKGLSNEDHFRNCLLSEAPPHRVRITRPFYLARYDVTQEEYQRITGANPSTFSVAGRKEFVRDMDTKQFPVETVSWEEAGDFCRKLSNLPEEKAAGRTYCLPSEAQWEYACRAGSMGRFSFNSGGMPEEEVLYAYGWFFYTEKVSKEKVGTPRPVGLKLPNAWGLYDMHGNVWQWCQDWYDKDYYAKCQSPADDPTGPFGGSSHVLRGGCLGAPAWRCRSAFRNYLDPGARSSAVAGFRVSLILADK